MEAVEILTILERAKLQRLARICKAGNTDDWNEVLCEERAYEVLSQTSEQIVATLGSGGEELRKSIEELVMKEDGRSIIYPNSESRMQELPEYLREALVEKLESGALD